MHRFKYLAYDVNNGELFWKWKKTTEVTRYPTRVSSSLSGSIVAKINEDDLTVIAMENGDLRCEVGSLKAMDFNYWTFNWHDEDLLVAARDGAGNPKGLARFIIAEQDILWSAMLPKTAKFPMTTSERVDAWVVNILVAGVTGAMSGVVGGGLGLPPTQQLFTPCLFERSSVRAPTPALSMRSGGRGDDTFARQRHMLFRERTIAAQASNVPNVSGKKGKHSFSKCDLSTGDFSEAGTYNRKKVHAIEFDASSNLVISLEDNTKTLRILQLAQ